MKKWIKIILLVIFIIGMIPFDGMSQDVFSSNVIGIEITDNVAKVSLRDPHPTHEYDKWFETNEYWSWWSYDAPLWSLMYRKDNGVLSAWRAVFPGYNWEWWCLGMYVPTLWLDFDLRDSGDEFEISIRYPSKHNKHCGFLFSIGWTNFGGWFNYYCDREP